MRARLATALLAGAVFVGVAAACGSFGASSDNQDAAASQTPDVAAKDVVTVTGAFVCPDSALFCDDFERDAEVDRNWSKNVVDDGGSLSLASDDRRAGGRSLSISIPFSATDGTRAFLGKNFPSVPSVRLSFAFRVRTAPSDDILLALIDIGVGGFAYVQLRDRKLTVVAEKQDGSNMDGPVEVPSILDMGWHELSFAYVAGPPRELVLVVDANPPARLALQSVDGTTSGVELGVTYARSGDAASFLFDDVRVESQF